MFCTQAKKADSSEDEDEEAHGKQRVVKAAIVKPPAKKVLINT